MSAQPQVLDNAAIVAKFKEITTLCPGWHAQVLIKESLQTVLGGYRSVPLSEQLPRQAQRQAWFAEVDRLLAQRAADSKPAPKRRNVGNARQIDLEEAIAEMAKTDIAQKAAAESVDAREAVATNTQAATAETDSRDAAGEVAGELAPDAAGADPGDDAEPIL